MEAKIIQVPSEAGEGPVEVSFYPLGGSGKRPLLLILPGGGYSFRSEREAYPIGEALAPAGVHAAVVAYAVAPARFPTALIQVAEVLQYFRREGAKYGVDSEQIFLIGFSAGGHLALSYAVYCGREDFFASFMKDPRTRQPEALLLAYPVVTAGPFAHRGSIENLLGPENERTYSEEDVSLELQVPRSVSMPPLFLWHTWTDESVPAENSLLLLSAYRQAYPSLPCECHFYEQGRHGLSLADERTSQGDPGLIEPRAAHWTERATEFLKARIKA